MQVHVYVCVNVCLYVCMSVYPSVRPSACLSFSIFMYLCVCVPVLPVRRSSYELVGKMAPALVRGVVVVVIIFVFFVVVIVVRIIIRAVRPKS